MKVAIAERTRNARGLVIARCKYASPVACAAHANRFAAQGRPIPHLNVLRKKQSMSRWMI